MKTYYQDMVALGLMLFIGLSICQLAPTRIKQSTHQAVVTTKLNLNEATYEALLAIPDIDAVIVDKFLEYRPYESIHEFRWEIGTSVRVEHVEEYERYVYVPINPNESDRETLQQLPGVNQAITAKLVADRPYQSSQAFLEALSDYVSAAELETAATYLSPK